MTPGRWATEDIARGDRGSTKVTIASWRMPITNCSLISTFMTSTNAMPTTSTATAKAMPITDVADRIG
jgi:hypothetical protein